MRRAVKVTWRRRSRRLLAEGYDTELIVTEDEIGAGAARAAGSSPSSRAAPRGCHPPPPSIPSRSSRTSPASRSRQPVATFEAPADEVVALSPRPPPPTSTAAPPVRHPRRLPWCCPLPSGDLAPGSASLSCGGPGGRGAGSPRAENALQNGGRASPGELW